MYEDTSRHVAVALRAAWLEIGGAPYLAYSYGYDVSATNNRTSAFAQDSWKIGDRLTINPGVRVDFIRGGNPTTGNAYSTNNAAPRLGFAWDVTGDLSTVVKGAYSQYYEGAMAAVFAVVFTLTGIQRRPRRSR